MDSIKVKNFIIIVLLIVNAILLSVFVTDTVRERGQASGAVDGAVSLLAENGIAVSADADLSERSLGVVALSRDTERERELVSSVLGDVTVTNLGGNILHDVGPKGEANFRGTGSFEMLVYDNDFIGEEPLTAARHFAAQLGLDTLREPVSASVDPETLDGTLELMCTSNSASVVNCRLSVTFSDGEIIMVLGTRVLDSVVNESGMDTLDVPTVLMRFLALVLDSGRVCSSLDSLELCYSMTATAAGDGSLVPVWRITTDTGEYYINAVSGLEETIT